MLNVHTTCTAIEGDSLPKWTICGSLQVRPHISLGSVVCRISYWWAYRLHSIWVNKSNGVPHAVVIRRNIGVFVCHRVNTEPHGHQLVVHISCSEIAVASFLVFLFPGENEGAKPHVSRAVYPSFCCMNIVVHKEYQLFRFLFYD